MSRIILTDIHGCYKTMLALIAKLPPGVPLTFAGDLIDRGPGSKDVIEFVKSNGHDCVLGNHEVMMLNELSFGKDDQGEYHLVRGYHDGIWLANGGTQAINSYKDDSGQVDVAKLKEHYEWLKTLPYYLEYPLLKDDSGQHLLVTHTTAGDVWGKASVDTELFKDAVTWTRKGFPKKIKDIFNIYGHTPQRDYATVKEFFACIDTGAYLKRNPYGKLTAISFPEMVIYEQENIE